MPKALSGKTDNHITWVERLKEFPPVTLGALKQVELLNRKDTKYLLPAHRLDSLLALFREAKHCILKIKGKRHFAYQSLYYDTPDFRMYLDQHNEKGNRYKIRTRTYLDSGESYIEIKFKNNKGYTIKTRGRLEQTAVPEFVEEHSPYLYASLCPNVTVSYSRITLVDAGLTERITIDTDLMFQVEKAISFFPELVIVEGKQDRSGHTSSLQPIMRELRIFPSSLSKYCLGIMMHYPGIKKNRFKQKLRYIQELQKYYDGNQIL